MTIFYVPPGTENSAGGAGLSAYHAAATPRLRLDISVAIDPRLSKSKIWNVCKKVFFIDLFPAWG